MTSRDDPHTWAHSRRMVSLHGALPRALNGFLALALTFHGLPTWAEPITNPGGPLSGSGQAMTRSPSGVPVLQVAAPNGAGVSINRVTDFDVDVLGLILNNSLGAGGSLLGGRLEANPNFTGRAATTLVAEVTGALPSRLAGPLEVFGVPAWTIIANPNGVSCDGCGILNAPRLSLGAGTIDWRDGEGRRLSADNWRDARPSGFQVTNGRLDIGRGGVEGTRAQVDLVGGEIRVDGAVRAGETLGLHAGQGTVALGKAGLETVDGNGITQGGRAHYLIDASAFGAMSAGQIDIVVSAAGAGVRSAADLAARSQDVRISATGDVALASVYAQTDARIESIGGGVKLGSATAQGNVQIDAGGSVHGAGLLEAGGNLAVNAGDALTLNGPTATRGNLSLRARTDLSSTGPLSAGGTLAARAGHDLILGGPTRGNSTVSLDAGHTLAIGDTLVAGGTAWLTGANIELDAPVLAGGDLHIQGGEVRLGASLASAYGEVLLDSRTLTTDGGLNIGGNFRLATGELTLAGDLSVSGVAHLDIAGEARFAGDIHVGGLDLSTGGDLSLSGALTSTGLARILSGGEFSATGPLTAGGLDLSARTVSLGGDLRVVDDVRIEAGEGALEVSGALSGGGQVALTAPDIVSSGVIASGGDLTLDTAHFANSGQLAATGAVHLGGELSNSGTLSGSAIEVSGSGNNSGQIAAAGEISLGGSGWNNGGLIAGGTVGVDAPLSNSGTVGANNHLWIKGPTLANTGTLTAGSIGLDITGDIGNSGTISANGLTINGGANLVNSGRIQSGGNLALSLGGSLVNTLSETSRCMAAGGCNEPDDYYYSQHIGSLVAGGRLTLNATGISNAGTIQSGSDLAIDLGGGTFANQRSAHDDWAGTNYYLAADAKKVSTGIVVAGGDLKLSAGAFSNQGGAVGAGRDATLTVATATASTGATLTAARDLTLSAQGTLAPGQHGLDAGRMLTINAGMLTVGPGESWSSGAAQVRLGGPLINYGTLNLPGAVTGQIDNLPTFHTQVGDVPEGYGAVCPAGLSDCVAVAYEGIATRGVASVGSLAGTLYNESSYASLGSGTYLPARSALRIQWEGTDPEQGLVNRESTVLDPEPNVPFLFVPGDGTIELAGPNTGVILGEQLTLTGVNLVNAPPADLQAAEAALSAARAVDPPEAGAGGYRIATLEQAVRPVPVRVRTPNQLLEAGTRAALTPPVDIALTRPDWAAIDLAPGTIQADTLRIDVSGDVVNFGTLAVVGETGVRNAIRAAGLINETGRITSAGSLVIEVTGDLTNERGSLSAQQLGLYAAGNLVNTGQIAGEEGVEIDVAGKLVHRTTEASRATLTSQTGSIAFKVGGEAIIDNADLYADKTLLGQVAGNLTVNAQTRTTSTDESRNGHEEIDFGNGTRNLWRALIRDQNTDTTVEGAHLQAGGDLQFIVGGDIGLQAANVTAGGALDLLAGGHLSLGAVAEGHTHEHSSRDTLRRVTATTLTDALTHHVTTLTAEGDMTLQAGGTIIAEGGQATARGNLVLVAGDKIETRALSDYQGESRLTPPPLFGADELPIATTRYDETTRGFSAQASGSLLIQSGSDIRLTAVNLDARDALGLVSGGKLEILSAGELHGTSAEGAKYTTQSNYELFGSGSGDTSVLAYARRDDDTRSTVVENTLGSGGTLALVAATDMSLEAVKAYGGADAWLIAGGDLSIGGAYDLARQSQTRGERKTAKNGDYFAAENGDYYEEKTQSWQTSTWVGSEIAVAGNLTARAGYTADGVKTVNEPPPQPLSGETNGSETNAPPVKGNLLLTGSTLDAAGKLMLDAANDLQMSAGEHGETTANTWTSSDGSSGGSLTTSNHYAASELRAGDALRAHADGNITINAGTLAAGTDLAVSAGGKLDGVSLRAHEENGTYYQNQNYGEANTRISHATDTLAETMFSAGGDLQLTSGDDLTLAGAALTAGGKLDIFAGNDLLLGTVQLGDYEYGNVTHSGVRNAGTSLTAAGDLTLGAARDLLAIGGQARTQGGDITLGAGRDIDLQAAIDTTDDSTRKHGGGFFHSDTRTTTTHESTAHGFETATGEDGAVRIEAGQDVRLQSVDLHAGTGGIAIHAGRDLNLEVATAGRATTSFREDDMTVWSKTHDQGQVTETAVDNRLTTPGEVALSAGGNIHLGFARSADETDAAAFTRYSTANPWATQLAGTDNFQFSTSAPISRSWDRHSSGLSDFGNALLIAVMMVTSYYGPELIGSVAGETAGSGSFWAAVGTDAACGYTTSAGLGNTIVSGFLTGTTVSAGVQLVLNEGQVNWNAAFKAGVGSAIGAGLDGYYGGQWSPSRMAAATVAGCASASVAGGDCEQGATSGLITAGLAWGGKVMRDQMLDQSRQFKGIYEHDSDGNELKTHTNVSGDVLPNGEPSLSGERLDLVELCGHGYGTCTEQPDGRFFYQADPSKIPPDDIIRKLGSKYDPKRGLTLANAIELWNSGPLGENQGGPGKLFGISYSPGSVVGRVVEEYAGPHDWWNNFWGGYETINDPANLRFVGNAARIEPWSLQFLFQINMNFVDLFLATPFAAGTELYNTNTHWLMIPVRETPKDKE